MMSLESGGGYLYLWVKKRGCPMKNGKIDKYSIYPFMRPRSLENWQDRALIRTM